MHASAAVPERLAAALAGRYTLERELGRGGMATVWLAHDLRHDRPVALKVLRPELAAALGAERFVREIRVAARLQHPHILPVFDSGATDDGLRWYTMPFLAGESLRDRLRRETQLPVDEALRIAREVAEALACAHGHGVVHRDVKPENILFEAGHAVVADFGIARALEAAAVEELTGTGVAIGTPAYMSPEQATASRDVDGRSDLYSLGCVLYEMLAGEPPFTGPSAQAIIARHCAEPPRSLRVVRPALPPALERVVERALAKVPADRFRTADDFARALAQPLSRPAASRRRTALVLGALVALGLVVASAFVWRSRAAPATLDADLLAVAPFDVVDPELGLWREGLVDVLARDLDGAGPLRTVSPTVVVRRWRGRADRASAAALGRRTGARLAVFGSLARSGTDSVRLTATVLDVVGERRLGEVEVRGAAAQMDRLTDSLAVGLLREVGRTRPMRQVRQAGLGARSLPALKAFLQAEQFYRRGAWDSTQAYAERAVALDSTFVLAHRLLSYAVGWQADFGSDSITNAIRLRAGRMNHGLAPRDSLLVLADSLTAALAGGVAADPVLGARILAVLDGVVRRYPGDPEAWYQLGEARHHVGVWMGRGEGARGTLEAFERSIVLDSLFAPAYFHPVELSLVLGDTAGAGRFAAAMVRLNPLGDGSRVVRTVLQLLTLPDSGARTRALDSLPADVVVRVYAAILQRWPDPAERPVQVVRQWVKMVPSPSDLGPRLTLAQALAWRGHVREALALREGVTFIYYDDIFPDAVALGLVPAERATTAFRSWLRGQPLSHAVTALPWWRAQRDVPAIRRFLRAAEDAANGASAPDDSVWAGQLAAAGRAHLALASRDTAAAIAAYRPMLDGPCPWWCQAERLTAARMLAERGRLPEAARILGRPPMVEGDVPPRPSDVLWYLERARVAERLGERARAMEAYQYVVVAWRRADPELQPYAAEARAALQRLGAEGGR